MCVSFFYLFVGCYKWISMGGVQTSKPGLLVHTLVISKRPELRIDFPELGWRWFHTEIPWRSLKIFGHIHRFHYSSYGKSPLLMGNYTINGPFSIATLNYQRVLLVGMPLQGMKIMQRTIVCVLKQHMETKWDHDDT